MITRTPRSNRANTIFPDTTLFRSEGRAVRRIPARERPGRGRLPGRAGEGGRGRRVRRGVARQPSPRHGPGRDGRRDACHPRRRRRVRSEEHTSELQSLMRNSYAVFCLKKKKETIIKKKTK